MTSSAAEMSDKRPASRQLADRLLARIESDDYKVGEPLPTYRELATENGVAVNTAMAAVRILRDRGVVTMRPNARPTVRDPAAGPVDVGAELNIIRSEVADLRSEINSAKGRLTTLEQRLVNLAEQVAPETE
jgi:DNA-binding transcriptional regulator YhcF (GntR family)